jgi:hypothetical protein
MMQAWEGQWGESIWNDFRGLSKEVSEIGENGMIFGAELSFQWQSVNAPVEPHSRT